ncbi:8323_t:CDS:2 [Racocetra persica]|uniref:8323_t:CDS:1 n=1 Tax=Racocetra persica TaxID=160502 RepID=A0ACA9QUX0_9GLOM|nr:8323_t:CDS:2 [Racocetra persica]
MTNQTYDHTSPNNSKVTALQDISSASKEEYSDQVELLSTYEKKKKYAEGKKYDKCATSWLRGHPHKMKVHLARNCDNAPENIKIK